MTYTFRSAELNLYIGCYIKCINNFKKYKVKTERNSSKIIDFSEENIYTNFGLITYEDFEKDFLKIKRGSLDISRLTEEQKDKLEFIVKEFNKINIGGNNDE